MFEKHSFYITSISMIIAHVKLSYGISTECILYSGASNAHQRNKLIASMRFLRA